MLAVVQHTTVIKLIVFTIISKFVNTTAFLNPISVYQNIINIMSFENTLYEELKWKDAPLYAPGAPAAGEQVTQGESNAAESQPPQHVPLKAESTALLIVDVQPEYWTHCPSVRKDFPNFEDSLKRTIETCRKQKAKIIWVRADYRYYHSPWLAQFERLNGGSRPDTKAEIPCDPNSEEFAWEDFATPEGGEVVITKKSWNSATNTALMDVLRVGGIENVLVCGLITSVCVQHSAFSVFEAGYRTLLVEDACGDRGMARHKAALALYGNYMYEITSSDELADEATGLQAAKPLWISFDSNNAQSRESKKRKVSIDSFISRKRDSSTSIDRLPYLESDSSPST